MGWVRTSINSSPVATTAMEGRAETCRVAVPVVAATAISRPVKTVPAATSFSPLGHNPNLRGEYIGRV